MSDKPVKMISLRDFRLATLSGHVIVFTAREPTDVPAIAVPDALAQGCGLVNPNDVPDYDASERKDVRYDLQSELRSSVIYLVCELIAKKNKAQEFDGGGVPREGIVSNILNFEVSKKELQAVWQEYLTAKSENREFMVHPDAADVLQIVQADSKNELLDIAKAMGIPEDATDGKQAKAIREILLKSFSGAVLT